MNRNVVAGIAIVCLIAGTVFLVLYASGQASASRGRDWTQKLGTVDEVKPSGVTYRYDVDGRVRTVTDDQAQAGRYTRGQRLVIYVNPGNSDESLLELGRRPNPWSAGAGTVLLLMGAGLGAYALKLPRSASRTVDANGTAAARTPAPPAKGARDYAPPLSRLRPPPSVPRRAPEDADPDNGPAPQG